MVGGGGVDLEVDKKPCKNLTSLSYWRAVTGRVQRNYSAYWGVGGGGVFVRRVRKRMCLGKLQYPA